MTDSGGCGERVSKLLLSLSFTSSSHKNKWLFRLGLAILALLKSAKKFEKQRKTTAKAVVFLARRTEKDINDVPIRAGYLQRLRYSLGVIPVAFLKNAEK